MKIKFPWSLAPVYLIIQIILFFSLCPRAILVEENHKLHNHETKDVDFLLWGVPPPGSCDVPCSGGGCGDDGLCRD